MISEKQIKVITQNCFIGRKVKAIIKLINEEKPDICCLQEITGRNFVEKVKKETKYNYILSEGTKTVIPKVYFHTAILTKFEILEVGEFNWKKKSRKWIEPFAGKALWSLLRSKGISILIYNCYFSIVDQGMAERGKMLVEIIKHANSFNKPAVICGDMNTTIPDSKHRRILVQLWNRFPTPSYETLGEFADKNEKYFFYETAKKHGFEEAGDMNRNTWRMLLTRREAFKVKLDWMLYRGLKKSSSSIGDWIGDHRAIIGNFTQDN